MLALDPTTGDTIFTGTLASAKHLAHQDRSVHEGRHPNGKYVVLLSDCDQSCNKGLNCHMVAEWGSHDDPDQAWRFALGALFGPLDDEYDRNALRIALAEATMSEFDRHGTLPNNINP